MAHIRIGDKSWNVTDDWETVLRHLTDGQTYVEISRAAVAHS